MNIRKVCALVGMVLISALPAGASEIHEAIKYGNIEQVARLLEEDPALARAPDESDEFNSLPLHIAATYGHVEIARLLLDAGAPIDAGDTDGTPAICVAAMNHHADMVALLINRGADVNLRDNNGGYSLSFAASVADARVVRQLLDAGADLDYVGRRDGITLLQLAVRHGLADLFTRLLDAGYDVNQGDNWGVTPLHWAVARGDTAIIRILFAQGARPSPASKQGETPLWRSVLGGNVDVVKLLLAHGADVDAKVGSGWTPLFAAAFTGNAELVTLLIEHGAEPDSADTRGVTPVMLATDEGQVGALDALIRGGASADALDGEGRSALHHAAEAGNPETTWLLIKHGANINRQDHAGRTPLAEATRSGSAETVDRFLAAGAGVGIPDKHFGRTPLHLASIRGYKDVAELLLDHGASVKRKDGNGKRPLDLALRYGHPDLVDALFAGGAKGKAEDLDRAGLASQKVKRAGEAVFWYLGHSGWAVRTKNHLLIFDYYEHDRSPSKPGLANGHIRPDEIAGENVTVFVTHEHTDHYDSGIFDWREDVGRITYVLGWELKEEGTPQHESIEPREERTINGMKVSTIKATDEGVGYVVEVDGLTIFHAGDHANMEEDLSGPFKPEIDYLAGRELRPDIALMPIVGCGFGNLDVVKAGVHYALESLDPKVFIPMHCGNVEYQSQTFITDAKDKFPKTGMSAPASRGDCFRYRKGKLKRI